MKRAAAKRPATYADFEGYTVRTLWELRTLGGRRVAAGTELAVLEGHPSRLLTLLDIEGTRYTFVRRRCCRRFRRLGISPFGRYLPARKAGPS